MDGQTDAQIQCHSKYCTCIVSHSKIQPITINFTVVSNTITNFIHMDVK